MADRLTRRQFLQLATAGTVSAVLAGCQMPRRWINLEPYVRPPEEQLPGVATWYATTCRQCPAGCGIVVRIVNGRAVKVEGNPEHPLNRGKLCARGQAGLQVLYNPDRLPGPVEQAQRGSRQFQRISWSGALNTLYSRLADAAGSVAIWCGSTTSGHLYDLFGRFAQALGAPAPIVFDLYSTLCGHCTLASSGRKLYGREGLPAYDLSHSDVVLSFGADFLGTWLSAVRYAAEFGNFRGQSLGKRGYLAQLEPRMSTTGAVADHWLPIRPGTEGLVAQAIASIIAEQAVGSAERVALARAVAGSVDPADAADAAAVPLDELERLARMFAEAERPLAIPGTALSGQYNAADSMDAVQALNVMSGVQTAIHPDGSQLPSLPTPKASAFAEVQQQIERMHGGEVKVLLVHDTNPVHALPAQAGFLEALSHVPLVVSFSSIADDTAAWADLILPDRTYLESWGYTVVSPAFRLPIISSQQPVVIPAFDVRSTSDVLLTTARGIPAAANALPWADEVAFLKEAIGALPQGAAGGSGSEVLWARFLQHGGWWPATAPVAAQSLPAVARTIQVGPARFQGDEREYPYFLDVYMSDFLADGRGASQTWLQGAPDPLTTVAWQTWVQLAPSTAQTLGVEDGDIVQVASPFGELEAPVYIYRAIRPDTVAIPIGQGHSGFGRYADNRGSNAMNLIGSQTDATGTSLSWAGVRVKIVRTGRRVALARFESPVGVAEGFADQAWPAS
jgi:anaerobic selenocysteine-containing dehydrogenase